MQFTRIDQSNTGRLRWCLVGDDGGKLAVFARPLACARYGQLGAADVRVHAGSVAGTEER